MIKTIILVFLVIQGAFTIADLWLLYSQSKNRSSAVLRQNFGAIAIFVLFWLIFFGVQTGETLILPTFNSVTGWICRLANLDPNANPPGTLWGWMGVVALTLWALVLISFWDYVSHRFVLHHAAGFKFHEYHHLPRLVFNGMPGISVRPFAFVATFLTYLGVLPLLYVPLRFVTPPEVGAEFLRSLPVLVVALTLILSIVHSSYLRRYSMVHRILRTLLITTPQEHLLHHSRHRPCNYGNFSTLWDRWFGSYCDPETVSLSDEPLGVPYPADFLSTLTFGAARLPRTWKERFRLNRFFE